MRLRNIPGAEEALENSKYVIKQPENDRGHFREQIFGNENPIHIEIGMGKGKFLLAMAQQTRLSIISALSCIPVFCFVRSRKWRSWKRKTRHLPIFVSFA